MPFQLLLRCACASRLCRRVGVAVLPASVDFSATRMVAAFGVALAEAAVAVPVPISATALITSAALGKAVGFLRVLMAPAFRGCSDRLFIVSSVV